METYLMNTELVLEDEKCSRGGWWWYTIEYLILLKYALKMIKVANFMLCQVYQLKK